jgi:hypothetical protein
MMIRGKPHHHCWVIPNGESKYTRMGCTGGGERDQVKTVNTGTVENLKHYHRNGNMSTNKTSKKRTKKALSKEQALEIFQAALRELDEAGIRTAVKEYQSFTDGAPSTVRITLWNVQIHAKNLVHVDELDDTKPS